MPARACVYVCVWGSGGLVGHAVFYESDLYSVFTNVCILARAHVGIVVRECVLVRWILAQFVLFLGCSPVSGL